jgi:hypothetical protein
MSQTFSVENFKGVQEITLSPTGTLVVIAGSNGAGKSSFIDAFVELFDPKGTRLTPKPIRDGETEARAEFTDTDLGVRIVRTWRKDDAGKLEVFALDGAKYSKPAEVVAELTGGLIFDPVSFLNLDEKRQRDALLAKVDLPFDLDALEREKAGVEERRRDAGREANRLQGALSSMTNPLDAPDEEVSGTALLGEIQNAQDLERRRADLRTWIEGGRAAAESIRRKIAELQLDLANWEATEAARIEELDGLPQPADITALQAKLAAVDQTNAAVRTKREYARVEDEYAAAATAQARAQDDLDAIEDRKAEGLAAATFPVDGLSVDESGVLFDGIPFKQVNTAAQRKVAFAIATAGTPKLRLVIVKDGDLLDADSLAAIRELAEDRGYTVLVERDRDESRRIGFTIVDGALAEGGA